MVICLVFTHLFTYLFAPWSRILPTKLTISQLVKEFLAFSGNRRFNTAFISARRHFPLFWARSIQSLPLNPTSWRSIYILTSHLCLGLPSDLLPSGFAPKPFIHPSPIRVTWPTHLVLLNLIVQNNIWWGVQIIKHLCMQFFQLHCYLVPIKPKYSQTPSAYVPPWKWVAKFHTHTKQQAKL